MKRNMKICFVIGAMNFSGAEKVLSIITDELKETQDIHVILLEKENGIESKENGIMLYGVKATGSRVKRLENRWKNINATVKKISPDILVSFGYVCNVNTIMSMRGISIPLVLCDRNDPNYDPRKWHERLLRKLLYPRAQGYVFQTERIRQCFSKRIQHRSSVIPNPIEQPQVRWTQDKAEKKFVTVARLDDFQKDQSTMIRSFAEFVKDHPDYRLEMYGSGPSKEKYEDLIHELKVEQNVKLMGKTSNASEVLSKAQGFLLTSIFEGMPNALMEAMAVGVPCISTDCGGGGARALYDYVQGVSLVPIGDQKAIIREMRKIITDHSYAQGLSNQAIRIVYQLDKEKVSNQWVEYLQQIIREA